jgi:hypothetical protein
MSERTEKVSEYGGGSLDYIMYEPQPWVHRMMGDGQRFVIEFCLIVRRKSMMRFPWHLSQRWQSYMYKVRPVLHDPDHRPNGSDALQRRSFDPAWKLALVAPPSSQGGRWGLDRH